MGMSLWMTRLCYLSNHSARSRPTQQIPEQSLTNQLINKLYYSLDHPVLTYIGEDQMYRIADGSYNNLGAHSTLKWAQQGQLTHALSGLPSCPLALCLIQGSIMTV